MKRYQLNQRKPFIRRITALMLAFVLFTCNFSYVTAKRTEEKSKEAAEGTSGYTVTTSKNEKITAADFADTMLENKKRSDSSKTFSRENNEETEFTNTAGDIRDIAFEYKSAKDILMQYITKDQKTVKILNNNVLYSCDIETGQTVAEYTFPEAVYNTEASLFYGSQDRSSAFIREDAGLLYFGYNTYYNTYSEDEIMNVIVYDLEKGEAAAPVQKAGYILKSVGADKNGNIYIGTDDYKKTVAEGESREAQSLLILSPAGESLVEKDLKYPINEFSGFCADGMFYYIDEYMAYSAYGYPNLMGRLMKGKFQNNELSLPEQYMTYAKNIYFGNYRMPVEILNDKYLVTFTGEFYPLDRIGDGTWSRSLYAAKKLERGSEYDYIYNAGVNSVIDGDSVYTLYDNSTVFVYSMSSGKKLKKYNAKGKIFNMKRYGDGLFVLETDGTHFFYEIIKKSDMKTMETKVYNMNNFPVYKGRNENGIIKKFLEAAPKNYLASLYADKGSGKAPYKESTLTSATKTNALKLSNYYRWLAGLTPFSSASQDVWSKAGKGAVLLHASDFDHSPSKPSDMTEAFYKAAKEGTSSSSIAMNYYANQYKIINTIRQWMDDDGYTVTGHRNNFLTRNATNIAYGFYGRYACQTVEYTDNPNPSGTAVKDNNEAAYAWPAAGDFPAEELSTGAYWTVNLNTDKLNLSNTALQVTITDLDTGKSEKRTSGADGLFSTSFWGKYISFSPPALKNGTKSYAGKRYKITLTNLTDALGTPAQLVYTVRFFSCQGTHTIDGKTYYLDDYGQPANKTGRPGVPSISLSNKASGVKVSWKRTKGATRYTIYRNGKKLVSTKNNFYTDKKARKNGKRYRYKVVAHKRALKSKASKEKTIYYLSRPKLTRVKGKKGRKLFVQWKKNKKASGYQIRYVTGKKKKTATISGAKRIKKTISRLKKGKTYKVTVRAYKKAGKVKYYSSWSKGRKSKVKR